MLPHEARHGTPPGWRITCTRARRLDNQATPGKRCGNEEPEPAVMVDVAVSRATGCRP